jgi:formylmethanofuran--tetrahydromethanopterin N-formyltransferase
MQLHKAEIVDTFAEAFAMWAARVVITAHTPQWADAAATSMTGFATSVIGCKCEAGIDCRIPPDETPDRRPGVGVLLFTPNEAGLSKRLVERIGQCVMTCPTTACFNGLEADESVNVGGQLRFFGDGYQIGKQIQGRRYWRIPAMEGEFLVQERFGIKSAVGGGNLLIMGEDLQAALRAAEAAAQSMRAVPGVILPFPQGIVRCGSKPGSKYKGLMASTNEAYCPTLRAMIPHSELPPEVGSVLEIVVDGLDLASVEEAMRSGVLAAAAAGARCISAGNYGGNLGKYRIGLHELLAKIGGGG